MNTNKNNIFSKIRSLSANYSREEMQKISQDISDIFEKELQQEINNEIMICLLESQNWIKVTLKNETKVDDNWCSKYIKNSFKCIGQYWLFENQEDATLFSLRWL